MSQSTPKQKAKAGKETPKKTVKSLTSKTTLPKTTVPKTTAAKTKPKVTTAKKSIKSINKTKKQRVRKTVQQTDKSIKTASQTQKATSKASLESKSAPPSLKDLGQSLAALETRMKRADTLTRKSVKALETAVTALDSRARKTRSTDKATLTRKVNQLSGKLTDMVAATQNSVNSELKTALANPSVERLQSALSRADQRLTQAETVQASAIAKINRHLAAMATTVDARISAEEEARKTALDALETETFTKIKAIEQDTANAFNQMGDKIIELSDEIKRHGEAGNISIREKVSEIALQTQTEFEQYRSGLETRIEAVETVDPGETRRLQYTISSLTTRLEELEHNISNMESPNMEAQDFTPPPALMSAPVTPPPPAIPQAPAAPVTVARPPELSVIQTIAPTASMSDAFTPVAQTAQTVPPNPYAQAQNIQTQASQTASVPLPPQDSHIPSEFDPRQYVRDSQSTLPQLKAEPLDISPPMAPPTPQITPPELNQSVPVTPASPADFMSEPYADPAYAERDDTMANIRIGGKPDASFTPPKLTGRNLRVAALATGVAVLGLVAAKGVLGSHNNDEIKAPKFAQTETATPATDVIAPPTVIEPIGNYRDNKPIQVEGEAAKTLNSAAGAGDAVAQFQLGLSYLEQGRTNEGVNLIRKSANQNQPAAQYRLAKLYEVGEGVEQDSTLARQLTERAARNGNRIAMHDLALYYAEGRGGVTAELPAAAKWFEKAAERGVVDSQFNLGVLFESGQGLPKSMTDAFVWYSIAATQGDQFAKQRIGVLSSTMSSEDLAAAQDRITNFKPVKIDESANGIFRNVAWANKAGDASAERITQVKDVQTLLSDLGYDIGGADGSMGPRTRAAIISFEQANGLPETGRVNSALVDRLELAAGA